MPLSNYPQGFSGGVNVRGLPVLNSYSGNVFWVKSGSGSDSGAGTFDKPYATIDYAIGRCTAGRGDVIMVKQNHAETLTTAIALDVEGVHIVGLGGPTAKPTLTGNGAIDVINVTAADCSIANLRFAAPETDAQTSDINVAAAGLSILDTVHIGSQTAKNKVDIITLASGGDDCLIDGARIYNTVVEVVGGIVFEAAVARPEVRNCFVFDSIGFTDGCISDEAAATGCYIHHNVFMNAKAATSVMNFVTNSTGVCSHNFAAGRHTTIASNVVPGTGMNFHENYVVEQAALNGLYIPAQDAD